VAVGAGLGLEVASTTYLCPDMDYGEFTGHCGRILRSLYSVFTIYGDVNDGASFWSGFVLVIDAQTCPQIRVATE
jgi:hypothetical protein